ncbi:hypothetical protein T01_10336 [Trichinella spiralis]|uniref:Uncharacterized protein n=1 Tax=Trichinella spiralis TaxID=6334 RepID=A0A0V1BN12_TRISP|nr:hypothetical protein T01_10336 [Trichinella spiralis]
MAFGLSFRNGCNETVIKLHLNYLCQQLCLMQLPLAAIVMDCDLNVRLTRSGRKIQELIALPDADISEPEMDSDDDQRSSSVVESSAELTSEDE